MSIVQNSIMTMLFLTTTATFASDQLVLCPSSNLINNRWQYMDTITIMDNRTEFLVYTNHDSVYDADSKRWWSIASDVIAPDFNTAFTIAQNNARHVITSASKYAQDKDTWYSCRYLDNTGKVTIVAITNNDESVSKIQKAMLNLH